MSMHKSGRNDTITPGASCDNKYKTQAEVTLGDYLENRAHMYKPKLTFGTWWDKNKNTKYSYIPEWVAYEIWCEAQENK